MPPPTIDYYTPPHAALPADRKSFAERNDPRKPTTAIFWSLAWFVPVMAVAAGYELSAVLILYPTLTAAWVIATLVIAPPRPGFFTAAWLSRRHRWLRIGRVGLWTWIIATSLWLWWLESHNAPVRLWWHPWIDLAPALQLFGVGLLALATLMLADALDAVRRWRSSSDEPRHDVA